MPALYQCQSVRRGGGLISRVEAFEVWGEPGTEYFRRCICQMAKQAVGLGYQAGKWSALNNNKLEFKAKNSDLNILVRFETN